MASDMNTLLQQLVQGPNVASPEAQAEWQAQFGMLLRDGTEPPAGSVVDPSPDSLQGLWEGQFMKDTGQLSPEESQSFDVNKDMRNKRLSAPGNPIDTRVAALNANHNQYGIAAAKDSHGHLVLSNYVPKPGDGVIPISRTNQEGVTGNVRSILNQLKATTDIDTARGLQAQLNEAAAQEAARIQGEARKHAETKLGIPDFERQLSASIELDRNSPTFLANPGIGDSPNTAKIRNALNTGRAAADLEVQRMMKSNVTQNALEAALKNAQMETARISRLADKKEMADAALEQRTNARKDMLDARLDEAAAGLSENTKMAIKALNPVLANATDRDLAHNFEKGKANPAYIAAITAPDIDLPKLAVEGNAYGNTLLQAREAALGIRPADTESRLRQLQEVMRSPAMLQKALKMTMPRGPDADKQIAAQMSELNAKVTGGKEEQRAAADYKYQIARRAVSQGITNSFMEDVQNWQAPDPGIAAAILQAKTVAGKTDITEVANAYIGRSTGSEARAKLEYLIDAMESSAKMYQNSVFGMPNTMAIRNKLIADQLRTRIQAGPLGTWLGWKGGNGIVPAGAPRTDRQTLFGEEYNPNAPQ